MYVLRRIPACLSALLLAAMVLRQGAPLALLIGALALTWTVLLMRWSPGRLRGLGIAVAALALPWLVMAWVRVNERLFRGESWGRLLAILLGVAAFTAWSGRLLAGQRSAPPAEPSKPGEPLP